MLTRGGHGPPRGSPRPGHGPGGVYARDVPMRYGHGWRGMGDVGLTTGQKAGLAIGGLVVVGLAAGSLYVTYYIVKTAAKELRRS